MPADVATSVSRDSDDGPAGTIVVIRDVSGTRQGAVARLTADIGLAVAQGVTVEGMLQLCAESMVRQLQAATAARPDTRVREVLDGPAAPSR